MKKCGIILIIAIVLLTACGKETESANTIIPTSDVSVSSSEQNGEFSMNDGRYVAKRTSEGNVEVPYILVHESNFTVVQQHAVSYQPSGMVEKSGNTVVMKSSYAEKEYCWVFQLVDNDTMILIADESIVPGTASQWEDGMVFSLDAEDKISPEELKALSQEYLSGGTAGEVSTITNWDDPIITIIDKLPDTYMVITEVDDSNLVYQVEYNTTQDGVLGPIVLYMDSDGNILGLAYRE